MRHRRQIAVAQQMSAVVGSAPSNHVAGGALAVLEKHDVARRPGLLGVHRGVIGVIPPGLTRYFPGHKFQGD